MPLLPESRKRFLALLFQHGIFWGWNALFASVMYFLFLPVVLGPVLIDVFDGRMPISLFVSAAVLLAIPGVTTIFAVLYLRNTPQRLLPLFYGLQAPLLFLAFFRTFLIRELTVPAAGVLLIIGMGVLAFGYGFFFGNQSSTRLAAVLRSLLVGFCATTALYLGALLGLYSLPWLTDLVVGFLRFRWVISFFELLRQSQGTALFWLPIGVGFLLACSTLAVVFPFALLWLYLRHSAAVLRAARPQLGRVLPLACALLVPVAAGLVMQRHHVQPQIAAFAALEHTPQHAEDRLRLLDQSALLRQGILNAYLAPYRYLGATGTSRDLQEVYRSSLHFSETSAATVQQAFNRLAAPFLYQGSSMLADRDRADTAYEQFFDQPIQKAEREAVQAALAATYDRAQREAGLLDIGQRRVLLAEQEVSIAEHGDIADIEIHEVYRNQTSEQQEIFYYFSLPETAVITGLWLGDSADRAHRFPFVVSTRGAAQRVYNNEVRRRTDPALLEQIGPRQYRLRAFPIPPRPTLSDGGTSRFSPVRAVAVLGAPPAMHLWMTYRTFPTISPTGQPVAWPLPRLTERRNVFFSSATERHLQGQRAAVFQSLTDEDWLPESLPFTQPPTLVSHQVLFHAPRAATLRVQLQPAVSVENPLPPGRPLAVVLDRSLTMAAHQRQVTEVLATLGRLSSAHVPVHAYLTSTPLRGEAPSRIEQLASLTPAQLRPYGGGQPVGDLLRQFAALAGSTAYRAIVVITDAGSMDFATDKQPISAFSGPVFFLHVGGRLAPGYDDATLATIQRRGGTVTTELSQILDHLASPPVPGVLVAQRLDGYRVTVSVAAPSSLLPAGDRPLGPAVSDGEAPPLLARTVPAVPAVPAVEAAVPLDASLAARALILARMQSVDHQDPRQLDPLHALAKLYRIVSPYSSMIVLVNDEQRRLLAEAEKSANRFDRTVESGKEILTTPNELLASGAPEPEEWLLIVLALAVVAGWQARIRRQKALTHAQA